MSGSLWQHPLVVLLVLLLLDTGYLYMKVCTVHPLLLPLTAAGNEYCVAYVRLALPKSYLSASSFSLALASSCATLNRLSRL